MRGWSLGLGLSEGLPSSTVTPVTPQRHDRVPQELSLSSREQNFSQQHQVSTFPWKRVHVFPTAGVRNSRERKLSVCQNSLQDCLSFLLRSDLQDPGSEVLVKYCTLRSKGRELLPHLDSRWEDRAAHTCPGLFQHLFLAPCIPVVTMPLFQGGPAVGSEGSAA